MFDCNPAATTMEHSLKLANATAPRPADTPYREAIGKLLYIALATRPDIAYGVSYLSRFSTSYD